MSIFKRQPRHYDLPTNSLFLTRIFPAVKRFAARIMKSERLRKRTVLVLRIVWIAALAACMVRWVTGKSVFSAFWRAPFRFAGFASLGRILSESVRLVFRSLAEGRFMWPPRFGMLGQLFTAQGANRPYTPGFLILSLIWMLRVIARRHVSGRPSSIPHLAELAALIPLFALIQNANQYAARNAFWTPVWGMAEIAALIVPLTGIIQWAVLRRRKQKIRTANLIAGLIAEALFVFVGFCLCI